MSSSLIAYYIENMASKEFIEALFNRYKISYKKSFSYRRCRDLYIASGVDVDMAEFTNMCRSRWQSAPIEYHKKNLSSGILAGHSWHRAMPSMLHYSLQKKVRECISTNAPIADLLEIGRDIMKHEYFMVATHDICESLIIRDFHNSLPPTRNKSISDFIVCGLPYDLKVSTYPEDFVPCRSYDDKIRLVRSLVGGADTLRMRNEAVDASYGWGYNRFYIVVADQDRWIYDTDVLLNEIMEKISSLGEPISVAVDGNPISVQLIEV